MTRPDPSVIETVVELLTENGFSQIAEVIRILLNEAMRVERNQALQAEPYQRSEKRRGYANGYKPKTLATRLGEIEFRVPQTRGIEFFRISG